LLKEGMQPGMPRPRVLVVDDDERSARLLARLLIEDGFDVTVAIDGPSALASLENDATPNLLVTDIRMPHVDGFAVARAARLKDPNIPVFIITSYPELVSRGDRSLFGNIFSKPLAYHELTAAMRTAGEHHGSHS
jgi:CheY-like chemotaxis protein